MTLRELKDKIRQILPDAEWEEDNYGQIVIYTNLEEKWNGELQTFTFTEE